jgi:hypothetical protein
VRASDEKPPKEPEKLPQYFLSKTRSPQDEEKDLKEIITILRTQNLNLSRLLTNFCLNTRASHQIKQRPLIVPTHGKGRIEWILLRTLSF